jgi:hypothetical protein
MKRPIPLYFVAGWCFLGLAVQLSSISRLVASHFAQGQALIELRNILSGIGGILALWHVARLLQLKSFSRWLSVGFFGLWTLTLAWNAVALAPRFEKPQRAIPALLVLAMLNVGSIWYLVRRSFRDFAVQFESEQAKEKHSRMMQKISQRKIRSGL